MDKCQNENDNAKGYEILMLPNETSQIITNK